MSEPAHARHSRLEELDTGPPSFARCAIRRGIGAGDCPRCRAATLTVLAADRRASGRVGGAARSRARSSRSSPDVTLYVIVLTGDTAVSVTSSERWQIERMLEVFEQHREGSRLPEPPQRPPPKPRPNVFIGHGRRPQWRDLKDHLTDMHGYQVEAYETGTRGPCHPRHPRQHDASQ